MNQVTDEEMQEHYDNFFQEVFVECEVRMIFLYFPLYNIFLKMYNLFPDEFWQMITIYVPWDGMG